jgi:hypothetical protein
VDSTGLKLRGAGEWLTWGLSSQAPQGPSTIFLSSVGGAFGRFCRSLSSPKPPKADACKAWLYSDRKTTDAGLAR